MYIISGVSKILVLQDQIYFPRLLGFTSGNRSGLGEPESCLLSKWYTLTVYYRCDVNWLFNVTINDISVIYVMAHRCAGGLKKKLNMPWH